MCPLQEKIKRTWTRHTQLNRESDAGAIYYTCRIKNFDENGHILSLLPFGEVKKQLHNSNYDNTSEKMHDGEKKMRYVHRAKLIESYKCPEGIPLECSLKYLKSKKLWLCSIFPLCTAFSFRPLKNFKITKRGSHFPTITLLIRYRTEIVLLPYPICGCFHFSYFEFFASFIDLI
ncbi:hypothetical protein RIR_jg31944.t2 [Rhizophagus irregularis DAOM 181602=DAOM 197198]|nr:hypothetical protein RIR_jg31944.t2 [Rhizophagus irregularis DAOM 181602=DAOM 197198]